MHAQIDKYGKAWGMSQSPTVKRLKVAGARRLTGNSPADWTLICQVPGRALEWVKVMVPGLVEDM